jgi:hypothetical protein
MSGAGRPPCGPPGMGTQNCNAPGVDDANGSATSAYVVNSKIMVVAVAVLFAVVVFILCLHVYAKWFWRTRGHGQELAPGSWRRRGRRDSSAAAPLAVAQSVGLEKAAIEALPTFEFEAKGGAALECAVCLEEFEPGETGRTLPKCGHHFHLDCVDMWLHSHSTCPLCRARVPPDDDDDDDSKPSPLAPVVHAPFMAAMRASRRQRARSLTSPTGATAHPPIPSEPQAPARNDDAPEASEAKALAREYEAAPGEIPSNVLFWGDMSSAGARPSASSIRAPFHVTIDIPRQGHRDGSALHLHPASVMSPMARASASFRRLLSRGKSVVSPHDDDDDDDNAADEGGPSSHSPRTPPPP